MQLSTQIAPPSCMISGNAALKIIRLHHLYFYQDHMIGHPFFYLIEYQVIDLFRIGDNKGLAGQVQKEFNPFAEKFQLNGEFPVKFMQGLSGTGHKEPYLPQLVYFQNGDDSSGYP